MSKDIGILSVLFDFDLERRKIPAFRGAVIEKVGRENTLFHNHLKDQAYLYSYPLIQYKIIRGCPSIVCLNYGTEEIMKFFGKTDWDLVIHGEKIETTVRHIDFDHFQCGFSSDPLHYRIHNWFALKEANFRKFDALCEETEKTAFLERIMIGNILSFAKGIEWNIGGQIRIGIPELPKSRFFSFKKYQMMGFTLDFESNIMLPDFIGLGKSVSRGVGMIRRIGREKPLIQK